MPARNRALLAVAVVCLAACGAASGPSTPAPPVSPTLAGTPLSYGVWSAVVPPDLTRTDYPDAVALDKTGCRLTVWPPVAAAADLDGQALDILTSKFPAPYTGVVGVDVASPLTEGYHLRGVTGDGWPFVELQGELLDATQHRSGEHVRIAAYQLGTQVAAVVGWESSPSVQCLSEILNPFSWTSLTYSVSFPSLTSSTPHALRDALVGGWFGSETGTTVSLAWSDVFSGNGQHSDLTGYETWQTLNTTQVLDTFSSWQGNSYWAVSGNQLTVWPFDTSKAATTRYFRVVAEYNTAEPSGWRSYLHRLDSCGGVLCEDWAVKDVP
jgi:hypothetical protein